MKRFQPHLWPTLIAAVMFAVLIALGIWQIQRQQWKTQLIADRTAALGSEPTVLNGLAAGQLDALLYHPITLQGKVTAAQPFAMYLRNEKDELGYSLLLPLSFDGLQWFLQQQGFAAQSAGHGDVEIPSELNQSGIFVPFTQYEALLAYPFPLYELKSKTALLPLEPHQLLPARFIPVKDFTSADYAALKTALLQIPNNHTAYAVTWFALALALLVIYFLSQLRKP